MTKVERRVIADGDYFEIACAVRSDGETAPASDLLDELEMGMWDDPNVDTLPDEWQPKLRRRLIAHIEQLAQEGELPPHAYNRLDDGIWELKVEAVRLSFYDTDGQGGWVARLGDSVDSWDGKRRYLLPEDFDEYLRLGHCFPKTGQATEKADLEESALVREEDVSHDR